MEQNIFISVDLGNSEIRMMAAERTESGLLNILAYDSVPTPEESILNGIVKKPSEVAFAIKDLSLKIANRLGNKFILTGMYVGINGRSMRSVRANVQRDFGSSTEITSIELDTLRKGIYDQPIKDRVIVGVSNEGYFVDGEPVKNPQGIVGKDITACYLLTCVRPELVDNIDKCFERISMDVVERQLSPVAIAEAVITTDDKTNGSAVINFGAATTTVAVYQDNYLRHVAVVPFGGKHITNDLKHLDLDAVNAEKTKCRVCENHKLGDHLNGVVKVPGKPGEDDLLLQLNEVMNVIEARLDEIIVLCLKEMDRSGYKDKLKAGIIVTGGVAKMKSFTEIVAQKTGMPVKSGSVEDLLTPESFEKYHTKELALLVGLLVDAQTPCMTEKQETPVVETKTQEPKSKKKKFNLNFGGIIDTLFQDKEGTIEE